MNRRDKKIFISIIIVFMALVVIFIFQNIKNILYDELDAAREEYQNNIASVKFYEMKKGDYVQSISITESFEDRNLSSTWFHTNVDNVTIRMNADFEELSMKKRCEICVIIMDEMRDNLSKSFRQSRYCQIFNENKKYDSMKYRNISLYVYHQTNFIFLGYAYEYKFPSYGNMSVARRTSPSFKTYYEYSAFNGKLEDFGEKYGNSKKESTSGNTSNDKSKKKNTSDPYDAKKYKSSQSFADDKYEEFYDYEDDYEDEDEAYDAAEDYWYEYN